MVYQDERTLQKLRLTLIANNKTINWIPETIGTGRFGAWLENVQDWEFHETDTGVQSS